MGFWESLGLNALAGFLTLAGLGITHLLSGLRWSHEREDKRWREAMELAQAIGDKKLMKQIAETRLRRIGMLPPTPEEEAQANRRLTIEEEAELKIGLLRYIWIAVFGIIAFNAIRFVIVQYF